MITNDVEQNPTLQKIVNWCTRSDISPLRYPGGKRKLAPFIADLISRTNCRPELFVEPFAGGASVSISLLEANYVDQIGLADVDPLVASFWKVVFSIEAARLADLVYDTEITLAEWKTQKALDPTSALDAAFKCLFLNRTSFSGSLHAKTGPIGGVAQSSAYKIDCRFNRTKIAERILELSRLRHRVKFVRNESYRKTMRNMRMTKLYQHRPQAIVWYMDPPFFAKADKLYRCHFNERDHAELAEDTLNMPGRWILSYDDHADARTLYSQRRGYARVNLQYSARIDEKERLIATEIVVSDIIEELRNSGVLNDGAEIIQIPRRRQNSPFNIQPLERNVAIG